MTFLTSWEDFEKAAERLYLQDPMKVSLKPSKIEPFSMRKIDPCHPKSAKFQQKFTYFHRNIVGFHHKITIFFWFQARYVIQYDHQKGCLCMKMTDDVVCIQYKSDAAQDVRRMEKFVNNLMRHMASKEAN